jgi:hypothetical protein
VPGNQQTLFQIKQIRPHVPDRRKDAWPLFGVLLQDFLHETLDLGERLGDLGEHPVSAFDLGIVITTMAGRSEPLAARMGSALSFPSFPKRAAELISEISCCRMRLTNDWETPHISESKWSLKFPNSVSAILTPRLLSKLVSLSPCL